MDHPADEVLARIAEGEISAEGELAEHLRGCATCTDVLSALIRARTGGGLEATARSPRGSDGAPKVHERIGRYRVERLRGEGAMGQVFEALDPELNHRVAVKVVRGTSSAELRGRLLREAQATRGPKARICAEAELAFTQYSAVGNREKELASVAQVKRTSGCPATPKEAP